MRISRSTAGTAFVGGALVLTLTALAYPSMLGVENAASGQDRIIANTQWGPLTEADRDFVVRVRAAGLWEYPMAQLIKERSTAPEMQEVAKHLLVGHGRLDAGCRKISTDLGITLPNEASPQQQQFVATAEGSTGKEFESTAVTIMRVAHGGIFPTIAKIRATTRNSLVRELADTTNDTVLDHITVLEKTGLINQEQVSFQITAPPKMPQEQTTPPPPQQGAPVRVLPVPEELKDFQTVAPNPSYGAPAPSPSAG
jgi:predicted outer membrane protein